MMVSTVCTPTHHTLCICSQLSLCRPCMVHGCSAKLGTVLCENGNGGTHEPVLCRNRENWFQIGHSHRTGPGTATVEKGQCCPCLSFWCFLILVNLLTWHFQEGTDLEIKFQQFGLARCLYKSDILYIYNFPRSRSISDESHSPLAPCHWGTF